MTTITHAQFPDGTRIPIKGQAAKEPASLGAPDNFEEIGVGILKTLVRLHESRNSEGVAVIGMMPSREEGGDIWDDIKEFIDHVKDLT